MTSSVKFFLFFLILGGSFAKGDDFRRSVDLEWEAIEGTPAYEIEVSKHLGKGNKKDPQIFKVKKPMWNGKLKAGQYEMRLRSLDSRSVPGEWSPPSLFWVKLPEPKTNLPALGQEFKASDDVATKIDFAWERVQGAEKYKVEIKSLNSAWTKTEFVSTDRVSIEVPVARTYGWRVSALLPDESEEEEVSTHKFIQQFTVVGKNLDTPKISVPDTEFVRELSWNKPEFAEKYDYQIFRKEKEDRWIPVEKGTSETNQVKFKEVYPGGMYRLQLKANAPTRQASETTMIEFKVYEGSRSPAAIKEAQMREAIEKPTNTYSIFSYFLTSMNYAGENKEQGQGAVNYNAIGGTGRIGLGYIIPKSAWGFFGIVDLSGFIIDNQNFTYASSEIHGVWRTYWGTRTQLRASTGLYYKEVPETISIGTSGAFLTNKLGALGPHLGFDIWQPMSNTFGIQLNARAYYSVMGVNIPNGQALSSTLSIQAGLLGSMKLSRDITGFLGYAFRLDNSAYSARVDRSSGSPSAAQPGDVNTVSIKGHYLNMILELGF